MPKKKKAHKCSHTKRLSHRFDAYYCEECDEWTEPQCSDRRCEFCRVRTIKPSMAVYL